MNMAGQYKDKYQYLLNRLDVYKHFRFKNDNENY